MERAEPSKCPCISSRRADEVIDWRCFLLRRCMSPGPGTPRRSAAAPKFGCDRSRRAIVGRMSI